MVYWTEFDGSFKFKLDSSQRKEPYCNNIMTLDMEVSTIFLSDSNEWIGFDASLPSDYYVDREKQSIVYVWMLSIDETVFYGRTLDELRTFVYKINHQLRGRRGIIYIHNLSYEFQFLRNIFTLINDFSRKNRQPMKCDILDATITFRCSSILSGLKLEDIPSLYHMDINKKVGQLDYSKVRHPETELTEKEMEYCEYDCLVVYEYIKIMLGIYKTLRRIPMTDTGKVRKKFREHLSERSARFGVSDWKNYVAKSAPDFTGFTALLDAFQGGYIHANSYHIGRTLWNIKSVDFSSSYPYVMVTEKYPIGKFTRSKATTLENLDVDNYAYLLKIRINKLMSKGPMCSYIPTFKAVMHREFKPVEIRDDNNRVATADSLVITVTDVDYNIIRRLYEYESIDLLDCLSVKKDYLPMEIVGFILKLYRRKTELKTERKRIELSMGIDSEDYKNIDIEYSITKRELNSIFGISVTNYITDEVGYDGDDWGKRKLTYEEIDEALEEQRSGRTLLMPYQWGVWVTAYARYNLIKNVSRIGSEVVYCDTDSIKYMGDHDEIIRIYNQECTNKVRFICEYRGYEYEGLEGLGQFEVDGEYKEFRTLGSKKYSYRSKDDEVLRLTMSGVDKRTAVNQLNNNINNFRVGLTFSHKNSGNLARLYLDNQNPISVTDYNGVTMGINDRYGIALYPIELKDNTKEYFKFNRTEGNVMGNKCSIMGG